MAPGEIRIIRDTKRVKFSGVSQMKQVRRSEGQSRFAAMKYVGTAHKSYESIVVDL